MKRIFYKGTLEDLADLVEQNLEDEWDEVDNWDDEDFEDPTEEELAFCELINLLIEEIQ